MSRSLVWLASLSMLSLSASCTDATGMDYSPKVSVSFPGGRADGSIPFEPGGRFRATVSVDIGTGHRLCGEMKANVELVDAALPADVKQLVTLALVPQADDRCSAHEATADLAYPRGGTVDVRATISGGTATESAQLDFPELALSVNGSNETRAGLLVKAPLCIESTAIKGSITVRLTGATLSAPGVEANATTAQLPLIPGGCSTPSGEITAAYSHADLAALTASPSYTLVATLDGTEAPALHWPLTLSTTEFPALQGVVASTGTLPPAGGMFAVTATVLVGGLPATGIPVRFQVIPETELLPVEGFTDMAGQLTSWVVVPPDSAAVRVDALVGSQRKGVTVP